MRSVIIAFSFFSNLFAQKHYKEYGGNIRDEERDKKLPESVKIPSAYQFKALKYIELFLFHLLDPNHRSLYRIFPGVETDR
jgi:hypothetical protein